MPKGPGLPNGFTGGSKPTGTAFGGNPGGDISGFFGKILSPFMPGGVSGAPQQTVAPTSNGSFWSQFGAAPPEGMTYGQWKPGGGFSTTPGGPVDTQPPISTTPGGPVGTPIDPSQMSWATGGGGVSGMLSAVKNGAGGTGTSSVDPFNIPGNSSVLSKPIGAFAL